MGLKDFFTKGPRVGRTRRDPLEEGGKQLGEELAAVWEERTKGKQLSSGRFPGETPFQELKILNNVENFLKNIKKTVDFFFSGSSTILRETNGWQQLFHLQKGPSAHVDADILELMVLPTLENFFN